MAAVCPNKSHPDYKRLLSIVKDDDSALYIYDQLGERIPSPGELDVLEKGGTLTPYHNQRVWDVNKAEDLNDPTTWKTVDGLRTVSPRLFFSKKAADMQLALSKKYFNEQIGFSLTASPDVKVKKNGIKPFDKRFAEGDEASRIHIINNFARVDEGFIEPPDESRQLPGIAVEHEGRAEAERQIEIFKKVIPIPVHVVWDETLGHIAQVEPAGKVTGITIRVNPTLLQKDTLGHEHGHILIDLLGGMSSKFIQQGRRQLDGTEIEAVVMAKYPDLVAKADDRIDKEILATAVGLEVSKIFKEQEQQNKWLRWTIRFFRRIRSMLGIEMSVARQLAERLVSGEAVKPKETASTKDVDEGLFIKGRPAWYTQESRNLDNILGIMDKMVLEEEELRDKARVMLQRKADILSKRGTESKEFEALEALIPRMETNSPTKALIQMVRFAYKAAKDMNDKWIAAEKAFRDSANDPTKKRGITAKMLSEWRTSVAAYEVVDDVATLFNDTKKKMELLGTEADKNALKRLWNENKTTIEAIIGAKAFKAAVDKNASLFDMLDPILQEVIKTKKSVEKMYMERGVEMAVEFLLPHSKHVEIQRRAEYEKEWLALSKAQQAENPRDSYIFGKIKANMPDIIEDTRKLLKDELNKASADVGFFTRFGDTILDSRDVVASSLAKVVFNLQEKTRREALEWKYQFADRVKALEDQLKRPLSMADEIFFSFMLETNEKGILTQNIISSVHSQLDKDFRDYKEIVYSDTFKDNEGRRPSQAERGRLIAQWLEKNAPRNKELWYQLRKDFVEKMRDEKIITDDELKRFLRSAKVTTKAARTPISEIFETDRARDVYFTWERLHKWDAAELSDHYKKINAKWYALEEMRKNGLKNGVQTDERVKFYDFIVEARDQAALRLPSKYALTTTLPSMMKEFGQRVRSTQVTGMSRTELIKRELSAKFQRKKSDVGRGLQEDEMNSVAKEAMEKEGEDEGIIEKTALVNEANEPVYFLPVYYVNKIDLGDQNFDLATIYFNYLKMAIDFSNKYDMLAEIEMVNYFANHRDTIQRTAGNKVIIDSTKKKTFGTDKTWREKALTDKNSMLAAQINDFIKMNLYDMMQEEERDIRILGFEINQAKLLDNINKYTAINLLGLNFIAGFANVTLGELTQLEEAFAGQYTSLKSLHKATKFYYKHLGGILGDIGRRRPTNIVNLLNDRFDTLHESLEGRLNHDQRFANLMRSNTLFFTSHAGEHYMQTRFMLSMLEDTRAFDKDGKDIGSILDNLYVDEKTNTLKVKEEVVNFGETEQNDFAARMHRVLSAMHGEYAKIGASAAQRYALFRMAIMFRKFVVPGFKRRWQTKGINNLLNDETEGFYLTFGRFAKLFFKDLAQLRFDLMREDFSKMTKLERANLTRMLSELSFFAVAATMAAIAMKAKSNSDDKDDVLLNNLAYQALRLRSELMFYINPMATMQILRSPMAAIAVAENAIKLFNQLTYPIWSGTFEFAVYEQGSWKGHFKIEKTITQLVPIYKQIPRISDTGDQLSWFNQ